MHPIHIACPVTILSALLSGAPLTTPTLGEWDSRLGVNSGGGQYLWLLSLDFTLYSNLEVCLQPTLEPPQRTGKISQCTLRVEETTVHF